MMDEMDHQMHIIQKDIMATHDQYVDVSKSIRTFKEGDMVFLRV